MYFSNAVVNGVVERLPGLFNFKEEEARDFAKKIIPGDTDNQVPFPVEPTLWPTDAHNATSVAYRGAGAMALVHGGGDGLIIKLNTGVPYSSFCGRRYLEATVHAVAQTGSVLGELSSRTLWSSISDGVTAPKLGSGTDADLKDFVDRGKHVEDVAARLISLAVEHTLVPFTQRTRLRNAAASYWCTAKYRSDNIIYSVQHSQALLDWTTSGAVGTEQDPRCVVWVGDARKLRGMSLLSRIMDQNGPIMLQDAFLLQGFDPGRLLMVGHGALHRDFVAIQPNDLMTAIDEALWLLVTYNHLDLNFITNALRLITRNLPIVDIAHYREVGALFWRTRSGQFGSPVLDRGLRATIDRSIDTTFGPGALEAVGLGDSELKRGVFSDLFRRVAFAPAADLTGLAPHTDDIVDWRAAGMLSAMQSEALGAIDGISVHTAQFDGAHPPSVPNMPTPERSVFDGVMAALSGRAGYHIYGYSQPPAAGAQLPVPQPGWALAAIQPPDLRPPPGVAQDGHWLEWVGGNDALGAPNVMTNAMRAYVIRQWLPTTAANYLNGYVAPPATLRTFDARQDFRMGVRPNGAMPDVRGVAPRIAGYVDENARGGDPLDYLTEEGQRAMNGLGVGQRSLAFTRGIAYVWDAANVGRTQNDAYRRWVQQHHADRELTTVPDELMLFLGGVRSRRYTEACGGLWTLCYTEGTKTTSNYAGHEPLISILRDKERFASYLLMLRSAIEMTDQLMRVSNARISGCAAPFLWPDVVDDRIARGRVDGTTIVDPASYLARQALILAAVFNHPDSSVARTFDVNACSTMRMREPLLRNGLEVQHVKHMNWLTPQTLGYGAWSWYYGVAAPTFTPDRSGRAWLRDARFTTTWQDVHEDFTPGAMIHLWDEVWSAVLTGYVYTDWYPATLEIMNYGRGLQVDVSDVRNRSVECYTQPLMRLNLPYETRVGTVTVIGVDHGSVIRPRLLCDGVSTLDDDVLLPHTRVEYNQHGLVVAAHLDPAADGWSNIHLEDTTFASGGLEFVSNSNTLVIGAFTETERSAGQFWMTVTKSGSQVAAGMAAVAQRLLTALNPITPLTAMDNGRGGEVRGPARIGDDAPDVLQLAPVGHPNVGDVPLAETNSVSANSLISALTSASPETMELIRNALLKDKGPQHGDARSHAATATTVAESDD